MKEANTQDIFRRGDDLYNVIGEIDHGRKVVILEPVNNKPCEHCGSRNIEHHVVSSPNFQDNSRQALNPTRYIENVR